MFFSEKRKRKHKRKGEKNQNQRLRIDISLLFIHFLPMCKPNSKIKNKLLQVFLKPQNHKERKWATLGGGGVITS